MGGSTPRNTTQTTITQYPEWLAGPMQNNIASANQLADQMQQQGYQGYSATDRIAGLNDYQTGAMEGIANSQGSWMPAMQQAANSTNQSNALALAAGSSPMNQWGYSGATSNAAYAGPSAMVQGQSFLGANVGQYMNPFQEQVTQNTLGNIEQARQAQLMQVNDAATKAKAFGGSRHGIVEGQTNAAFAKQAADTAANLNSQNFLNAQGQINADQNRNLQAQGMNQGAWNQMNQFNAGLAQQTNEANAGRAQQAGMFNAQLGQERDMQGRSMGLDAARILGQNSGAYMDMANNYQNLSANDYSNLLNAGNQLQDQEQLYRDHNYQEFLNQQQFPIDLLNLRMGAVTNTPYAPGSSTTSPVFRNRTAGFLGGAATGAQAGASTGNPWLALGGALLGGYMGSR